MLVYLDTPTHIPPYGDRAQAAADCTRQVQKRKGSNWRQKELGFNTKDTRTVLTTEDLTIALEEASWDVWCLCVHAALSLPHMLPG